LINANPVMPVTQPQTPKLPLVPRNGLYSSIEQGITAKLKAAAIKHTIACIQYIHGHQASSPISDEKVAPSTKPKGAVKPKKLKAMSFRRPEG
jgi:hypothetical protein